MSNIILYTTYICIFLGVITLSLLIWFFVMKPIIHSIKRLYVFFILKKVNVPHYHSPYGFILGPNSVETITWEEFEKKYHRKPKFKDSY